MSISSNPGEREGGDRSESALDENVCANGLICLIPSSESSWLATDSYSGSFRVANVEEFSFSHPLITHTVPKIINQQNVPVYVLE